jgi:modulator of FtsH protease HflC
MNNRIMVVLGGALLAIVLLANSLFVVRETEYAIKFRFSAISSSDFRPGLHFKWPLIDTVVKFDRRVLARSFPAEQFLTSEGKILNVDFYVKWRIADVDQYYRSNGGSEERAAGRLAESVKDGLKGLIAKRTVQQVVAAERSEFIKEVVRTNGRSIAELGVALVDVRVKRIDLPDEVSDSVFERMRTAFGQQAAQLRAEGSETAERIRAEADRQRTEILASAMRDAEKIRGEGDARAAAVFARAAQVNPEFYTFYRSMQAYKRSLGKPGDVMVVSPDSEFFRYMKQPGR